MAERLELTLRAVLAPAPDPRWPRGRWHPLAAILSLAVCAMPGGGRHLYAIAQWGRQRPEFYREQPSGVATLHHVFRWLAGAAFEDALSQWAPAASALAVDGKALRGSVEFCWGKLLPDLLSDLLSGFPPAKFNRTLCGDCTGTNCPEGGWWRPMR